jgi:hypothetical protein
MFAVVATGSGASVKLTERSAAGACPAVPQPFEIASR